MNETMKKTLNEAFNRHFSLIPVGRDKKPLGGSWKIWQEERATKEQLRQWEETLKPPAWAIVTGKISGIVVLERV